MRWFNKLFASIGFVIFALGNLLPAASADTPQDLERLVISAPGSQYIGRHFQYIEDHNRSYRLEDVMRSSAWQMDDKESLNFGFSDSAYWLKIKLTSDVSGNWYFWNRYSLLDKVTLYLCTADSKRRSQCRISTAGDSLPFAEREIAHPNLIFALPLTAGNSYDAYIFVDTQGTYQLPIELIDGESLRSGLLGNNILRGGYYSMMIVMGLYNLFIFFSIRDRSYLFYSAFVASFLLFHMSYEGSAFQYFWPNYPELNNIALPFFFALAQLAMSWFIPSFLRLEKYGPTSFRLFRIFSALAIVFMALALITPYRFSVSTQNLFSSLMAVSALVISTSFWLKGHRGARFFTIAWVMLITGMVVGNLSSLGIVPTNLLTLFGYQFGSFFEVVFLSLALGERIIRLQDEHTRARKKVVESQQEAIRYLQRYEDIYQNSINGHFRMDDSGAIIKANKSFTKLFGYQTESELLVSDMLLADYITTKKNSAELWENLNKNKRVQGFPITIRPYNSTSDLQVLITLRHDQSDDASIWIGSTLDVTHRHQNELDLQRLQTEKTQSLRQLVMGVSHEMNTPLGNIQLATTFVEDQIASLPDKQMQQDILTGLTHITTGVHRLSELNALIRSSAVADHPHQPETLLLRVWIQDWQQRIANRFPDIDLDIDIPQRNAIWHGYAVALDQILNQLVDNSWTHNEKMRQLKQRVKINIYISMGKELVVKYFDNGIGIEPELREEIFMPFYTTQRITAKSKGLGLYQTRNLVVELMKGEISWPETNKGFSICLHLPDMAYTSQETTRIR